MDGKRDHLGHRARLRARFLSGGGDALADHELLELLLFQAIPRQDTKPIAKALLHRFGTYAAVLRATAVELRAIQGVGEAAVVAIKTVAVAAERLARKEVINLPVLSSWDKLVDYLRVQMAHQKTESFRVLFLDTRNRLIADEEQQRGTVNHTPLYPREVMKRALDLAASAVILVHNHPSGDPSPSKADIDMTRQVRNLGAGMGVIVHDHVIVARSGHSSFRSMGLL